MTRAGQRSDRDGIEAFMAMLSPEVEPIVRELRTMIRRASPAATESVVWGALSYHLASLGGRVKGAVCQICVRGRRAGLAFIHGSVLSDPKRLLEGNGKSKRVVRLDSLRRVDWRSLDALIRNAVEVRPDVPILARRVGRRTEG